MQSASGSGILDGSHPAERKSICWNHPLWISATDQEEIHLITSIMLSFMSVESASWCYLLKCSFWGTLVVYSIPLVGLGILITFGEMSKHRRAKKNKSSLSIPYVICLNVFSNTKNKSKNGPEKKKLLVIFCSMFKVAFPRGLLLQRQNGSFLFF